MNCRCFQCKTGYESNKEDDVAGDGRCPACAERAKLMALKVDVDMSNRRREGSPSRIRQLFTEEQIRTGLVLDNAGRVLGGAAATPINPYTQLGITSSDHGEKES